LRALNEGCRLHLTQVHSPTLPYLFQFVLVRVVHVQEGKERRTVEILGIDIGGSGIKGAIVNVVTGELTTDRHRIPTPGQSTPENVASVVAELARHFEWSGPIGCTFPAIVRHGVVYTAANVHKSWIGTNAETLFREATGCPVRVLNDADAAGLAEMVLGAGKEQQDKDQQDNDQTSVVIMLTFGTGIGSAIFVDGHLLPNTEFGHLPIRGKDAEHRASAKVRDDEDLSWSEWAERVNEFLEQMEFFFSPDLFIIGGGVSKKQHKFLHLLKANAKIVPAALLNEAGIIGAASAARHLVVLPSLTPEVNGNS
jgi:polyphosphate glucokinase